MDNRFTSKFSIKNLFFYKNKVFLVLIGFIFSLALLNSVFIWADTSERMVITKFSENNDYMFSSTSFLRQDMFNISNYYKTDNLVKASDLSIRSEVLFNIGNKDDTYRFYPLDDQENPNDPIITGTSLSTNRTAFVKIDHLFEINGTVPTQNNEILINNELLNRLNTVLNTSYGVGSSLNLSISRNFPETDAGQNTLEGFHKKDFSNIVITGIVRYKGLQSMMDKIYSDIVFTSFIIFAIDNLGEEDLELMNDNGIRINSMITFKMKYLFEYGIGGLIELLLRLSEKIKTRYYSAITVLLIQPIRDLIQEFNFSFNSIYLYLPLISLALLLSNFAATILLQNREDDIKMLREKGATNLDLIRLFAYEFFTIALLGILIGFPVSILLSILIPNITSSGGINFDNAELFAQNLQLDPSGVISTIITVLGIFLISVSYRIHLMVFKNNNTQNLNPNQINYFKIGKLVLTILLVLEMINLFNNISSGIRIQEFQLNIEIQLQLRLMIFIFNIVFVLISQYLSNLVMLILKSLNTVMYEVLPSVSYLVNKNYTRKHNNVSTLSFFLIFLMAILALSSTLDATYQRNDE
ncbi:MAG: FtsX-like permease family protein, partial [Candidatus Kariarchaeaceae archaeon]